MLMAALAAGRPAQAFDYNYNRVMATGTTLLLGHLAQVNPDCTSRGAITIRVLSGPSSGAIRIVHRADYGHFTSDFAQCSSRKVLGESVYYTPQNGFIGTDTVQLDVFGPSGGELTMYFTVTVK